VSVYLYVCVCVCACVCVCVCVYDIRSCNTFKKMDFMTKASFLCVYSFVWMYTCVCEREKESMCVLVDLCVRVCAMSEAATATRALYSLQNYSFYVCNHMT